MTPLRRVEFAPAPFFYDPFSLIDADVEGCEHL